MKNAYSLVRPLLCTGVALASVVAFARLVEIELEVPASYEDGKPWAYAENSISTTRVPVKTIDGSGLTAQPSLGECMWSHTYGQTDRTQAWHGQKNTGHEFARWFMVDFGAAKMFDSFRIWNGLEFTSRALKNVDIYVSDTYAPTSTDRDNMEVRKVSGNSTWLEADTSPVFTSGWTAVKNMDLAKPSATKVGNANLHLGEFVKLGATHTARWFAFKINSVHGGDSNAGYGNICEIKFFYTSVPDPHSTGVTDVTANSATLNGNLELKDGIDSATVNVVWGTTDGGTDVDAWGNSEVLADRPQGAFSHMLSGLQTHTKYYYAFWSYDATAGCTNWCAVESFETLSMTTAALTGVGDVSASSARLDGSMLGVAASDVVVVWGDEDGGDTPEGWDNQQTILNVALGNFTYALTGLSADTDYYAAFIIPGGSRSEVAQFTTVAVSVQGPGDFWENGPVPRAFTFTLSSESAFETVVTYQISGSAAETYASKFSGSLTFPAGTVTKTIEFKPINDLDDSDKVLTVTLQPGLYALGTPASATSNILDDDGLTPTECTWGNGSGDYAWETAGNWSSGFVPRIVDTAIVEANTDADHPLVSSLSNAVASLKVSNGHLAMSAGELVVQNDFVIGDGADQSGAYVQTDGYLRTQGSVKIGNFGTGSFDYSGEKWYSTGQIFVGYDVGGKGTLNITGGSVTTENGASQFVGYNGTGTLNLLGGSLTVRNGGNTPHLRIGYNPGAVGTVVVSSEAGELAVSGGSIMVGDKGSGSIVLQGGTVAMRYDLRIANEASATGIVRGWGVIRIGGQAHLFNNGILCADGFGSSEDRTLDLSKGDGGHPDNTIDNPADGTNGWYAVNRGKLSFKGIGIGADLESYTINLGEKEDDESIDLVNSARVVLRDVGSNHSGNIFFALFALDHSDVQKLEGVPATAVGAMWKIHLDRSFSTADVTFRYDHVAAPNGVNIWRYDAAQSSWVKLETTCDRRNRLATVSNLACQFDGSGNPDSPHGSVGVFVATPRNDGLMIIVH